MTDGIFMRTPLTEEQAHDLRTCYQEWLRIREENGYKNPPTSADIYKGCLLGRMTMQGKPPLPTPPPLAHSAPWYGLIENNGADLSADHGIEGPYDSGNSVYKEGRWLHIYQYPWKIISGDDSSGYLVTNDRVVGHWTLRHRNDDTDPLVQGGTKRMPDGSWVPYYLGSKDWILLGPTGFSE